MTQFPSITFSTCSQEPPVVSPPVSVYSQVCRRERERPASSWFFFMTRQGELLRREKENSPPSGVLPDLTGEITPFRVTRTFQLTKTLPASASFGYIDTVYETIYLLLSRRGKCANDQLLDFPSDINYSPFLYIQRTHFAEVYRYGISIGSRPPRPYD